MDNEAKGKTHTQVSKLGKGVFFLVEIQISTRNSLSVDELFTLDLVCWLALSSFLCFQGAPRWDPWTAREVSSWKRTNCWRRYLDGSSWWVFEWEPWGDGYALPRSHLWRLVVFSEDKLDKFEGRLLMVFYGILTRTAGENLIKLWFEGWSSSSNLMSHGYTREDHRKEHF